jgi:hypothetical protein
MDPRARNPVELSSAAIAHLHQGNKIAAIKQIREEQRLDLVDAKRLVDRYVAEHPELQAVVRESARSSGGQFVFGMVFAALLAAAVYFWLMH